VSTNLVDCLSASAYLMRSPPVQVEDDKGRADLVAFLEGNA
jgi:hypothetical protein